MTGSAPQPHAEPNASAEMHARLVAKQGECDRLLRLVNRYKEQITDLDIEVVKRDQLIEELQARLAMQQDNKGEGA